MTKKALAFFIALNYSTSALASTNSLTCSPQEVNAYIQLHEQISAENESINQAPKPETLSAITVINKRKQDEANGKEVSYCDQLFDLSNTETAKRIKEHLEKLENIDTAVIQAITGIGTSVAAVWAKVTAEASRLASEELYEKMKEIAYKEGCKFIVKAKNEAVSKVNDTTDDLINKTQSNINNYVGGSISNLENSIKGRIDDEMRQYYDMIKDIHPQFGADVERRITNSTNSILNLKEQYGSTSLNKNLTRDLTGPKLTTDSQTQKDIRKKLDSELDGLNSYLDINEPESTQNIIVKDTKPENDNSTYESPFEDVECDPNAAICGKSEKELFDRILKEHHDTRKKRAEEVHEQLKDEHWWYF
ncbi:hypothetical protein [Photobacterium leiognathi]|uniref:hypothetical protein n=1 Tax=Photobacterium leiognathi TaxID=553611 RepID=UPI002981167C|nr:hypothetical protein [Photobacterium leiognathi]